MLDGAGKGGFARGDICRAVLPAGAGGAGDGARPVLVIQNDIGNRMSDTVIVAAITSRMSSRVYPVIVALPEDLLSVAAEVRLNRIHVLDRSRIGPRLARLSDSLMSKVDDALCVSLGLPRR